MIFESTGLRSALEALRGAEAHVHVHVLRALVRKAEASTVPAAPKRTPSCWNTSVMLEQPLELIHTTRRKIQTSKAWACVRTRGEGEGCSNEVRALHVTTQPWPKPS